MERTRAEGGKKKKAIITDHAYERAKQRIGARARAIGVEPSKFGAWLQLTATNALNSPAGEDVHVIRQSHHLKRVTYGEFTFVFDLDRVVTVFVEKKSVTKRMRGDSLRIYIDRSRERHAEATEATEATDAKGPANG